MSAQEMSLGGFVEMGVSKEAKKEPFRAHTWVSCFWWSQKQSHPLRRLSLRRGEDVQPSPHPTVVRIPAAKTY